jgi:protein TonB
VKFIQRPLRLAMMSIVGAIMAACSTGHREPTPPDAPSAPAGSTVRPGPTLDAPAPSATVIPPVTQLATVSYATTERAYRRDAATHLYAHNAARIYKGLLQPHLYAIGVLDVDIDRQGQVTGISWRRAPRHAPEVMAEIVRTVRQAAPYPIPARMGRVTYSDVWLWDKSGQFQLDTLTEGQM